MNRINIIEVFQKDYELYKTTEKQMLKLTRLYRIYDYLELLYETKNVKDENVNKIIMEGIEENESIYYEQKQIHDANLCGNKG